MEIASKFDLSLVIPRKFRVEKYPYSILKVIPYKTGYNGKEFEKIINTISKYNKSLLDRFEFKNKELLYHPKQPISYEILYTKDKISYYYAVPSIYKNVFINKLRFLLDKCDILEEEDYLFNFNNSTKYSFNYKKNWMFGLNSDDKINLIDSLILLNKDLQQEDKVLLQILLQPLFDYEWKEKWERSYNKFSTTGLLSGGVWDSVDAVVDRVGCFIDMFINGVMSAICGEEPLQVESKKESFTKDLSNNTKHKSVYDGFKTNINLFIDSKNSITHENISRNALTIFKDIEEDNSLKINKAKTIETVERKIKHGFITNATECKQFIKLPSETMLKEYENLIDRINVSEIEMPRDLFEKGIAIGDIKKGSVYRLLHLGNDPDSNSKPIVFLGGMGCGKSTLSRNFAISFAEQGHSVLMFDTIDNKSFETVRDYLPSNFPEDKIITLDLGSDVIFPLLWNEISDVYIDKLKKETDDIKKYKILEDYSGIISNQFTSFINTIQAESREQMLTPQMSKILNSIAQLVFMNNKPIATIIDCLYDEGLRHQLLDNLKLPLHLPFCKDILRIDNESTTSTTFKAIESRLNLLMDNLTMKKMFSINPENKLTFDYWLNNGYVVLVNVPENKFGDNINPIITFLMQKAWMSLLASRVNIPEDKRKMCHIILDEIHRFPYCLSLMQNKILECRKWRIQPLFFLHNFDTFGKMAENLKASGATFITMPTSDGVFGRVSNFYEPYGYAELKEVEKLNAKYPKMRFALCSIHYKNCNFPCVVKLLPPPESRYKKVDRKYLVDKCNKAYGFDESVYYKDLFNLNSYVCNNNNNCKTDKMQIDDDDVAI